MSNHWIYSDDPRRVQRGAFGSIALWIIGFVVLFGVIGSALWGFGVFSSDVKGKGDAYKTKNSGTNRIAAQERFEELYQDILAADQRIDTFAAALNRSPDSQIAQTNLTGAITYCQQVVADYNATARKYTAKDFRSIDLPEHIDSLDSTTNCKEN